MTIEESNRLIAEFMDQKPYKEMWNVAFQRIEHDPLTFKYERSWDWLMPVVEKIESFGYAVFMFPKNEVAIKQGMTISSMAICKTVSETKIKAVYLAVIEFIQWYNENNRDN